MGQKNLKFKLIITTMTIMGGRFAIAADLTVQSPGQLPGREMQIKKSGVPTYNLIGSKGSKTKTIPRLQIGQEPMLSAAALAPTQTPPAEVLNLKPLQKQNSPAVVDIRNFLKANFSAIDKVKEISKINPTFHAPEVSPLKEVTDPKLNEAEAQEQHLKPLSPSEEKLLQAMILLERQKSYHLALGLLAEVMTESKELRTEASFYYAQTAQELGLPAEHRFYMLKILKESGKDWQKKAILSLTHFAIEGDTELVTLLDSKVDEFGLELVGADQFQMNRAHFYGEKGDLSSAMAAVDEIKENSPLLNDARFFKGVLDYRAGKTVEAEQLLQATLTDLEKTAPESDFKSMAAITLARVQFQRGQYKESFQSYLAVNKSNPLWMQAMVEQAWAQILTEDYEGAAGNMYSLHTDFFKNSFSPESYVARAVGYLNLCQFGDGAKVVYSLNHRYMPMKDMLEQYRKHVKNDMDYYDTVRTFFKNPQVRVVDGLHRNFVFEIARHPDFVREQKRINSAEDQIARYNALSLDLIQIERTLLQKQGDLEAKIVQLQKKPEATANNEVAELNREISNLKIKYQIAKRARGSLKDYRASSLARLETQKTIDKKHAAVAVKSRFDNMYSALTKTLDQAELLRYELYTGAGEHLRYQMAGGEITDKDHEALKVQDGKALKWDFKGEVWEDELGHFRSSLKNVCPKDSKVTQN